MNSKWVTEHPLLCQELERQLKGRPRRPVADGAEIPLAWISKMAKGYYPTTRYTGEYVCKALIWCRNHPKDDNPTKTP